MLLQVWTDADSLLLTHSHEMKVKGEHIFFFSFTCTLVLEQAQLPRDCTPGRCSYTAETQRPVGRMNSPFSVQSRQCAQAALGSPLGQHRRSWRKQEHSPPRWHCTPHLCTCYSSLHHSCTACCQGQEHTHSKLTNLNTSGVGWWIKFLNKVASVSLKEGEGEGRWL